MSIEPAKRVTAIALQIHSNEAAAAHFAGFIALPDAILGLTPQALRWRPLRGLAEQDLEVNCGMQRHPLNVQTLMRQVCYCR